MRASAALCTLMGVQHMPCREHTHHKTVSSRHHHSPEHTQQITVRSGAKLQGPQPSCPHLKHAQAAAATAVLQVQQVYAMSTKLQSHCKLQSHTDTCRQPTVRPQLTLSAIRAVQYVVASCTVTKIHSLPTKSAKCTGSISRSTCSTSHQSMNCCLCVC